jgi:hypothetical protein
MLKLRQERKYSLECQYGQGYYYLVPPGVTSTGAVQSLGHQGITFSTNTVPLRHCRVFPHGRIGGYLGHPTVHGLREAFPRCRIL